MNKIQTDGRAKKQGTDSNPLRPSCVLIIIIKLEQ